MQCRRHTQFTVQMNQTTKTSNSIKKLLILAACFRGARSRKLKLIPVDKTFLLIFLKVKRRGLFININLMFFFSKFLSLKHFPWVFYNFSMLSVSFIQSTFDRE